MPGRVVVVGSVNIDLVMTVEHLPAVGETVTGGEFARHHGGKGANQAVAAARLGARTMFVGALGDDQFGTEARTALAEEGVDLSGLVTIAATATGVATILVDARGDNAIAVSGGANAVLTGRHVAAAFDRAAIAAGDVVLVGHEIPTETARAALAMARASGATTIFNPAPATGLDAAILALADVVTPNEQEAIELQRPANSAGAMLISMGAAGARLSVGTAAVEIRAPAVAVVDSVGAGDTLNGALAAGLAKGLDLESAARRAVVAASLSVQRAGAREGMPTRTELAAALKRP